MLACLERGIIAEQKARIRPYYRSRRDALLAALETHMPAGVTWTRPEGGLFVWATLPPAIDADVMLTSAVEAGVAYVPGGAFYVEDVKPNTMRLTFASAREVQIDSGIVRLADVVRAALR